MGKMWIIAEVKNNSSGGKGVFRYLKDKPTGWKTIPLSEEISISWNYEGVFPDGETTEQMDEFEETIVDLCFGVDSCISLVMTVGGLREWCFYVKDYVQFIESFNQLLAEKPQYPISIEHSHDPEWQYWHSFVDNLEK